MTLTQTYADLHQSLAAAARMYRLVGHDARVALAIYERGGQATSPQLYHDLGNAAAVRRSIAALRAAGLATAAAVDGGRVRRGINLRVTLTPSGEGLAKHVIRGYERAHAHTFDLPDVA